MRRFLCFLFCLVLLCRGGRAEEAAPAVSPKMEAATRAWKEKLKRCDAALATSPDSLQQLSARGDTHLFLGHFAEAVADYERMIALDPAEDAPHWRLGIAYYFTRQWEKSSRQFAKYHAYDGHDRENGVWKFLADVQAHGLEAARREMLVYREFDREPFPSLYEMLAGRLTRGQFQERLREQKLTEDRGVMFFAHYYGGLYDELQHDHAAALREVAASVALYQPEEAAGGGGPGFMWQAARLQLALLAHPALCKNPLSRAERRCVRWR